MAVRDTFLGDRVDSNISYSRDHTVSLFFVAYILSKARKADIQMIGFKDRMVGAWHVPLFSSSATGS